MGKQCIYPGCDKEDVAENGKIPLCEYHKGILKEQGVAIGGGVIAVGGTIVGIVKAGGIELIKKGAPKIAKAISTILKR